jgi:pimeloyl-ACP methyl ester carboxylesterase
MPGLILQYHASQFHISRFGSGRQALLTFHGFSENGKSFFALEPSLGEKFTIYAFDLPYHGETKWNEPSHFTTNDLIAVVRQFLTENKIDRFSVMGFSMGGKCALYIANSFPEKTDALFLLASDGIKTNKIYNVAVYPKWGRELFKTTIRHPRWFFFMINALYKLKILSPWLFKFTNNHMETKEKRQRLYNTWISMSEFNPDIKLVKEKINQFGIHVFLFFGKRDEVIKPEVGIAFCEGLHHCKLTLLERGHYFIDDKLNPFISEALKEG